MVFVQNTGIEIKIHLFSILILRSLHNNKIDSVKIPTYNFILMFKIEH